MNPIKSMHLLNIPQLWIQEKKIKKELYGHVTKSGKVKPIYLEHFGFDTNGFAICLITCIKKRNPSSTSSFDTDSATVLLKDTSPHMKYSQSGTYFNTETRKLPEKDDILPSMKYSQSDTYFTNNITTGERDDSLSCDMVEQINHDLRNIMNCISGSLQLINRDVLTDENFQLIFVMDDAVNAAIDIIEFNMDESAVRKQRLIIKTTATDVAKLIDSCISAMRGLERVLIKRSFQIST